MDDPQDQIDELLKGETEPQDPDATQSRIRVSQSQEARLKRVLDYQAEVLSKESHLEAALGAIKAGLMGVAVQMDELIEEALAVRPKSLDQVQRLLPTIQTYLQATRQIDRLTQVEVRVAAAGREKSDGKPARPR